MSATISPLPASIDSTRFALIGCGDIARKHMIALGRIESAQVVCCYDINPTTAQTFGQKNGIPFYSDVRRMLDEQDPEVFCILTPSGTHADSIFQLVDYGKHFVVEKPLALRLDHIDSILERCDQSGLKLFVVQQNRFNPPIQKLKDAIQRGRFGKLVLGTVRVRWRRDQAYYDQKEWRGTWAHDGGVFTNQASHHIDMLIWMMGNVLSVVGKTTTRLVNIEAEDTGAAIITFTNGAVGIIEATTATRPKDLEGSISILGEKGAVEVGGFFMNELKTWQFAEPNEDDKSIWETFGKTPNEIAWNHTQFYQDVIRSLRQGHRGLIDGLEGRKSVELIQAIYESADTGKEVPLRFAPKNCRLGR
ncbi:MAG: Gfo/Idh/MocA family protein [Desulfomonilaceae bacterium]